MAKSTIIEAIVWCLFGKTRQDVVDDVVNRKIVHPVFFKFNF